MSHYTIAITSKIPEAVEILEREAPKPIDWLSHEKLSEDAAPMESLHRFEATHDQAQELFETTHEKLDPQARMWLARPFDLAEDYELNADALPVAPDKEALAQAKDNLSPQAKKPSVEDGASQEERVHQGLRESFPASDPPSFTPERS